MSSGFSSVNINASSYSEQLRIEQILERLSLMLLKYSEGLMRLLESELPGKLGGTKGSTRCLLTKFGKCLSPFSSTSVFKLIMVKSEQEEELCLRDAEKEWDRLVQFSILFIINTNNAQNNDTLTQIVDFINRMR